MTTLASELSCLTSDSIELAATASGRLDGIRFVVKDLLTVAGHISSFGNARWRETHTPSRQTSPIITKLLNNGATLAGLAKMDQLAGSLVGNIGEGKAPLNPCYPDRFTGGSSSGSASAVAGDFVDFAIGTDTAGSVRVPAAACGLYGLRPTHGSISSEGVIPWAASFDVVGILSKNLSLMRNVYEVLGKKTSRPAVKISQILLPSNCIKLVSSEAAQVVSDTAQQLADAHGIPLHRIDFDYFDNDDIRNLFSRIASRENWHAHGNWIKENNDYLAADLRARMEIAEGFAADTTDKIRADLQARELFRESVSQLLTTGSLLVLPVMHDLAPLRNANADELQEFRKIALHLNAVSGLSGLPEIVIPARDNKGTSYGVGLIGAKDTEIAMLDFLAH